ncbi:hypothetical protein [uncultured Thiodictyon sp.]|jgi:hypothetical protein|uniref:hypothetical protein n=1 Tax=uncultured Thiodictyon sp. TaxID=1846217 RepID=UPI0025D385A9|nr:hypothetical protein [uncultured Thiodictyon sp.]
MKQRVDIQTLLSHSDSEEQRLTSVALLSLGVVESLVGGAMTASEAVEAFFHADNCLYVRRQLRHKIADEIMGRAVQLPDIFDALPAEEAQREFQREVGAIRTLCLSLLDDKRMAA